MYRGYKLVYNFHDGSITSTGISVYKLCDVYVASRFSSLCRNAEAMYVSLSHDFNVTTDRLVVEIA